MAIKVMVVHAWDDPTFPGKEALPTYRIDVEALIEFFSCAGSGGSLVEDLPESAEVESVMFAGITAKLYTFESDHSAAYLVCGINREFKAIGSDYALNDFLVEKGYRKFSDRFWYDYWYCPTSSITLLGALFSES